MMFSLSVAPSPQKTTVSQDPQLYPQDDGLVFVKKVNEGTAQAADALGPFMAMGGLGWREHGKKKVYDLHPTVR
jgi:hypothetical protein